MPFLQNRYPHIIPNLDIVLPGRAYHDFSAQNDQKTPRRQSIIHISEVRQAATYRRYRHPLIFNLAICCFFRAFQGAERLLLFRRQVKPSCRSMYTACSLPLSDLFHVFSSSLLTAHGEIVPHCRDLQTPSTVKLHPSACAVLRGCARPLPRHYA